MLIFSLKKKKAVVALGNSISFKDIVLGLPYNGCIIQLQLTRSLTNGFHLACKVQCFQSRPSTLKQASTSTSSAFCFFYKIAYL